MQPCDLKIFYMCILAAFSLIFTIVGIWLCKKAIDKNHADAGNAGIMCFIAVFVMLGVIGNVAGIFFK